MGGEAIGEGLEKNVQEGLVLKVRAMLIFGRYNFFDVLCGDTLPCHNKIIIEQPQVNQWSPMNL